MQFIRFLTILVILSYTLLIISCDAPRRNPLDPNNPDNNYYFLKGAVKTISLPSQPLENVAVDWLDRSHQVYTNSLGTFTIEAIGAHNGWLRFEKSGYLSDSMYVEWHNDRQITVEIFMNASPQIDSLLVYSVILNRYPSLQTEKIIVEAKISDQDNDIDSVTVNIDYLNLIENLPFNITSKWYQQTFSIFDLDIDRLEILVGHPFLIEVKDIFNHKITLNQSAVERVIRDEVLFVSPSGNEITGPSPVLTWQNFEPGFTFTYMLQIFTAEITPQLIWEKSKLDPNIIFFNVDTILPVGEYFWVIWAIDEFGNRTRSKPASFIVE